jgi:hypothetical protein
MLLRTYMPGFRNVRYPERLSLLLILGLCPLVALGLAQARAVLGRTGVLLLSALVFLEHLALPQPLSTLASPSEVPSVYTHLAEDTDVKVLAEIPAAPCWMERADAVPMYLSTYHWKRIVEGYTSYFPPTYNLVKWRLFHFKDNVSFFPRSGVDTILVKPPVPDWTRDDPRWETVGPFKEGHVLLRLKGVERDGFPLPPEAPGLVEVDRSGWKARGSSPGAALALDGDPKTAWVSGVDQRRGQFFQLFLPSPVEIARISLDVRCFLHQGEEFPTHLEITYRTREGDWTSLPVDQEAALDRFFARLLHAPRTATLDYDIPPTVMLGLRLKVTEDDAFAMPWTLTEIRLYRKS